MDGALSSLILKLSLLCAGVWTALKGPFQPKPFYDSQMPAFVLVEFYSNVLFNINNFFLPPLYCQEKRDESKNDISAPARQTAQLTRCCVGDRLKKSCLDNARHKTSRYSPFSITKEKYIFPYSTPHISYLSGLFSIAVNAHLGKF